MTQRTRPPYRADHVGSFLRPKVLLDAREQAQTGAIVGWVERLRAGGVTVPIRVGVAGIATIRTLLNYARRCGIGNSIRALGSEPISRPRLLLQHGPERIVARIAAAEAGASVAGLHCFPFGGFAQTARWLQAVAAGRFRLEDSGFALEA